MRPQAHAERAPASPQEGARRHERLVMALACAGSFVVILDATIVSVALPDIRASLGFSPATLPWVVNAYTLAFAGFLLLGGRCADVFGRRAMLLTGMAVFTAARVLGGLAVTPEMLLAARAVQGLGGALLMPVTLSLLTTTFTDPARRARALGTWSAVGAIGAASGPVIGGVLTQWAGWRWVFFVTVPVGALTLAGAARGLPRHDVPGRRPRLDVVGAALVTAGLTGVVYALMRAAVAGWTSLEVMGALAGGFALLGIFLLHQARWAREPLVALDVFRSRAVSSGNVVMFLLGLGFFASPILLSLYLQDVHGWSPLRAGLGYLPVGVAMFAGAQAAGPLTVRLGPRRAAVSCCLLGAAGFAGVAAFLGVDGSYVMTVVVSGGVFGFGTAAAFTPITVAATSGVPPSRNGLAAGVLNTVRQTSGAIGLAVLSTVSASAAAGWAAAHPGRGGADAPSALAHGHTVAFLVSAGCVAAAALVAALAMPRSR
ncbi:MFS transporter [Actinomadura rubrisoli]|uniref:DHA2 family efflux MFS transporter permease subunit n=1 Tax=Actinomadura rubrisoli TaxID=2530368 RepID=A0A4R5CA79_9ACTN|nr:MFS transporter [Actinomadura rubrisoli]TDD96821.1 DHA2 family efflux MFS transporter permease subunit [Actinomadura rubrisoli]